MKFQLFFFANFFLSISSWIFRKILRFFRKKKFFLRENFIFRFTPHTCHAKFFSRVQTSQRKKIHHLFFRKFYSDSSQKNLKCNQEFFAAKKNKIKISRTSSGTKCYSCVRWCRWVFSRHQARKKNFTNSSHTPPTHHKSESYKLEKQPSKAKKIRSSRTSFACEACPTAPNFLERRRDEVATNSLSKCSARDSQKNSEKL